MSGFWMPVTLHSKEPDAAKVAFFEKSVRPLLAEKCFSCHSEAAKKSKGGLVVDSLHGLLTGGDTGPALIPGKPAESLLVEAIQYKNVDLQMPPKARLADNEIAILVKWIADGAVWPNSKTPRKIVKISDEDRQWWAFQPIKRPIVPENAGNPIDHFIDATLREMNLTPSARAEREVLIRRVTLDLTGLPPTPADMESFVQDRDPNAYFKLVDRLLATPRYGERAARLWLDLVRYADSDGYRLDEYRPHSWRYRDYVIAAFNEDKPYDRFVQEQIAGDELFPGDPQALIATGYLRHWIYEYNQRDVRTQWELILDDITDTTADVFLGMGLQCARCHDHKFDPLLQKDYFRLRAFFAGILPREDQIAATPAEQKAYQQKLAVWETKTATIRKELDEIEAPYRKNAAKKAIIMFPEDIQEMINKPASERTAKEHQLAELAYRQVTYEFGRLDNFIKGKDKERVLELRRQLATFDALKPPPLPVAFAVSDVGPKAAEVFIPKRPDNLIDPGFITILDEQPAKIVPSAQSTGRRTALAKWLTSPENPLTSRVIVNRLWQQHFGKGLAVNSSDFGKLGEAPSHPELLDWLASELMNPTVGQHGNPKPWSLKHIHRLMVTSAAYQRSAEHANMESARKIDPENRYIWTRTVQRMDAEQIRDSFLAVTGELTDKTGGPGAAATVPCRTIYTKTLRNQRNPLLDVFDAPFWFSSSSSRDTTTTPVQSLYLFNSQYLLQRSKAFSARLQREEPSNEEARIDAAYRLAFGRAATSEEIAIGKQFLAAQQARIQPEKTESAEAKFEAGKIPFRDGQAADVKLNGKAGFEVPHHAVLPEKDFTLEAYIYPRTIAETGTVRTIISKWAGNNQQPGWAFGITGKKSRRKPQTLVLQMIGKHRDGSFGEEALFSDQHIALNKPYYVAVSFRLATKEQAGEAVFFVKDLSNDDEQLGSVKLPVVTTGGIANNLPVAIGSRKGAGFDGLLDEVRISNKALVNEELLFLKEAVSNNTVGHWSFEPKPNLFHDLTSNQLHIRAVGSSSNAPANLSLAAWNDYCHVLLNASEFFYIK
ncbi:MAG: DUF1549 domain-containing protein [Zavarzinella sp.]